MKLKLKNTTIFSELIRLFFVTYFWDESQTAEVNTIILNNPLQHETFIEGESLHLQCEPPSSNYTYEYSWYRKLNNSNQLERLTDIKDFSDGSIRPNGNILKVNVLYTADSGQYNCTVKLTNKPDTVYILNMRIQSIQEVRQIFLDRNNIHQVTEQTEDIRRFYNEFYSPISSLYGIHVVRFSGEAQIFTCSSAVDFDAYNVTWYTHKYEKIYQMATKFNLVLQNLSKNDEATYFCIVNSNVSTSLPLDTYKIHVFDTRKELEMPKIVDSSRNRVVYTYDMTSFLCIVTNKTAVTILWLYSNLTPVQPTDSNDISKFIVKNTHDQFVNVVKDVASERVFGTLRLKYVNNLVGGWYTCVVKSEHEDDKFSESAFLEVKDFESSYPYGRNFYNITVWKNSTVTFNFPTERFPKKVSLEKLGSNAVTNYGKSIMEFKQVNASDEGWYAFNIITNYGESKFISYLKVEGYEKSKHNIVVIIILVNICAIVSAGGFRYLYRRIKKQRYRTHYMYWRKKVVIRKPPTCGDREHDILKLPVIHIVREVSRTISMKSLLTGNYIFPLDRKWEISRKNIQLEKCIEEGEFSKIVQATAFGIGTEGANTTVAVKMLKGGHSKVDMINLFSEMEMMKAIGKHSNIVNLVGCSTRTGNLLVIIEYTPHGNLRDYLRQNGPGMVADSNIVSKQVQVFFAWQIARGMEYLASKKCVHSDLATRNVLVCDKQLVKIANFGLSVNINEHKYYKTEINDRLPIKWMAPEALLKHNFSTKSDVWSFGILLWEIMTYGGTPYASAGNNIAEITELLKSKYRLEKPESCSGYIYRIMNKCWSYVADERPSFTDLIEDLQLQAMDSYFSQYNVLSEPNLVSSI